uniref:Uncharacterized protein n=1 Tax=Anguilla anguilla TaxID=7936 RepID=A0A0E9U0B0_ANGAN
MPKAKVVFRAPETPGHKEDHVSLKSPKFWGYGFFGSVSVIG